MLTFKYYVVLFLDNWRREQYWFCNVVSSFVSFNRPFYFQHALNLSSRPPFHNSSLILPIFIVLYIIQRFIYIQLSHSGLQTLVQHVPWIFLVAWSTHHIRDATRHGLWFWPFGSTKSLPQCLYIGLVMLIPLTVRVLFSLEQYWSQSIADKSESLILDVW